MRNDQPPAADAGLHGNTFGAARKGLGTSAIVLIVVAAAAPLTVTASTIPILFSVTGNSGAPAFFIGSTAILVLFSIGFTRMSRYVKNAGAFYSYVKAGLGRDVGLGAAMLALASYYMLLVALYCLFGAIATNAVEAYTGAHVPWWLLALVGGTVVSLLGYHDINLSAKVLGVALLLETLVVLVLDFVMLSRGGAEGLTAVPFFAPGASASAWAFGLMYAVLGFIGFEATAVFRHEARDAERTIPRATYVAVIVIGVFYTFTAWAITVGIGLGGLQKAVETDGESLVFNLGSSYLGSAFSDSMQILVVTSLFACVLAFHNVLTRYLSSLGAVKVLPSRLGVLKDGHQTPSFASATLSVLSLVPVAGSAVLGIDPFATTYTWLSGTAVLGILILMALTNLAVIVFFRRSAGPSNVWATLVAPAASFLGMAIIVYMVIANFTSLVGNKIAALILAPLLGVVFLCGVALARVLRASRPHVYANLAESYDRLVQESDDPALRDVK